MLLPPPPWILFVPPYDITFFLKLLSKKKNTHVPPYDITFFFKLLSKKKNTHANYMHLAHHQELCIDTVDTLFTCPP